MSLFKTKVENTRNEQRSIEKRIDSMHIQPTDEEQIHIQKIIRKVSDQFANILLEKEIDDIRTDITEYVAECCNNLSLEYEEKKRIEKIILNTVLGHGPIENYLQDDSVSEIIVQKYDNICIERNGRIEKSPVAFIDEQHLQTIIKRIIQKAGRQINLSMPIVDARLEDGSRVNATIPPISPDGATLTIRKFTQKKLSGADYLTLQSLDKRMLYFLERCVRGKISIFTSGGTGTGKTTLLNMLSSYIPSEELIITIEDTCELQLQQPNVRRMETRLNSSDKMMEIDQKMLVKAALRQRPDRIIMGEVRDGAVVDLLSAMSSGHEGSMSTGHANNPENLCNVRIPILYSMNRDADFSEQSIAMQISEAIQIIVQITRLSDGSRKITHISHVDGLTNENKVNIQDIFVYDLKTKKFRFTGYIPQNVIQHIRNNGLEFNEDIFRKEEGS